MEKIDHGERDAGFDYPDYKKDIQKLEEYIQNSLNRKNTNLCGVLVTGHVGTGKSFFVENYLKRFEGTYPIIIARHNPQQEAIPYSGFKHGISDFLSKTYKVLDKDKFERFSESMRTQLGEHFPLLFDYIPELSLLTNSRPEIAPRSTPKVENQLYSLFKVFFEFLSDYHQKPLFFFTDDLQHIDGSGMNLLTYLLLQLGSKRLIWIGACRKPQDNPVRIKQLIESINFNKKHIENISLKRLTLNQSRYFVENLLGSPCSSGLVEVSHQLTRGNLSQLQVLIESLKNTDLIFLKQGTWEGKVKTILKRYNGQNSFHILQDRLNTLNKPVHEMLCLISIMGEFNRNVLAEHFHGDITLLDKYLEEAVNAGLLENGEKEYRFSDPHIGEIIYEGLGVEQTAPLHYHIATLLGAGGCYKLNILKKIMITRHFNQSLDLVRKHGHTILCAGLNYQVACFYNQERSFNEARYFFKISADLYKECPWESVKDKVWKVYMDRARMEYAVGEYDPAEIHLDFLLERFSDPIQLTDAFELKIIINNHLGRYRKVVSILKESLLELGLEIPMDECLLPGIISKLKGKINDDSATCADADLPRQNAVLKLLYVGGMALHHTSDILMTWAALQIITRSQSTRSAIGAVGYVSYGRMCIIAGNITKGYEFGKKGLDFNEMHRGIQYRCRVLGVFAFYILPWKRAFNDSFPMLEEGMRAGKTSGDLIGHYILKTHQFNLHFISGSPLQELVKFDFEGTYPARDLTYYITHYQKSLVRYLVGEAAVFSIPREQPPWLAAQLTIREERFYRNHVWARYYFLFGHYKLAAQYGREAQQNQKLQEGSPLVPANLIHIFLSLTQNWINSPEETQYPLFGELRGILDQIDLWSQHAPINYIAARWLLYAEWYRIKGENVEKVIDHYSRAIADSGSNLFIKALSHELLGKFYLGLLEGKNQGKYHLHQAVEYYEDWGAIAKARQLIQQYQFVLEEYFPQKHAMDIEEILRELSGDLQLDSLIKKLLVLLLRISSSTFVAIEWIENHGEYSGNGRMSLLQHHPSSKSQFDIPHDLILMAHRTQDTLVVNDLNKENSRSEVSALQERGVKSFVIFPITINDSLSMTIYLENTYCKNCYQTEVLKWIRITVNQGGIVIENARTHEKTVKLNRELRRQMNEKQQLASLIELQKDAHLKELLETQEKERKRIAGDLHDSLGSLLSSIKLRFNGMQELLIHNDPKHHLLYHNTLAKIDEAVEEVRRISHNMSPVSLRRFGLRAALQTFIEQIKASQQLDAELQILGLESRLPEQLELALYRICQELVQNVIRHAKSGYMYIQIINHPDVLNLIVEDNGIGMDKEKILPGFGFTSIQTKLKMFKGNFSIESQPGMGCTVIVDIPMG